MAEFVRAQIFGTTFEITSRYDSAVVAVIYVHSADSKLDTPIYSL